MKKITFALALVAQIASADVYKWIDEKGITHYGDNAQATTNKPKSLDIQNEYSQPIDIEQAPNTTPKKSSTPNNYTRQIKNTSTDADFNTCADQKRYAVQIERQHEVQRSEEINEWLFKNCRGYSNELRIIEQQMM